MRKQHALAFHVFSASFADELRSDRLCWRAVGRHPDPPVWTGARV